jgi:peptidoglycan/xylan/chitin deacetylase (PgdA/CDA1 family)
MGGKGMSIPSLFVCVVVLLCVSGFAVKVNAWGSPQQQDPPWKWREGRILDVVNKIRAGRDLTPQRWPRGARMAVGLSFDFDNETVSLRDGQTSPALMAQGEYGARAGLPRILAMLDQFQIPATFFVPAISAKLHPDSIKDILAKGKNEIGIHGWIHERNSQLNETDERELMRRSIDVLSGMIGKRPVGLRTPSWDFSPNTMKLIKEFGLVYDSSLMADDRPYEILIDGSPSGVVELPVEWIMDDFPYFGMDRTTTLRPYTQPDDVFNIWKAEFDKAYDEGTMFILTMHPHVIGHRSRIVMLERLITYMKSRPGVWFATHEEIARAVQPTN